MPQRPTARFTTTDNLAIGVLAWCRDNGVAVPGDVAVVRYDNVEAAEFAEVPLTTINYAADKVSDLAIDRLLSLIADVEQPPQVTLIEPELVVRRSCGSKNGR